MEGRGGRDARVTVEVGNGKRNERMRSKGMIEDNCRYTMIGKEWIVREL